MQNKPGKTNKLTSNMIQYGKAFNILSRTEDDLDSQEAQEQLSEAQNQAQRILQEALIQVEQTLAQAQTEAALLLEQAQNDAMHIQTQAQEIGQKMGFEAGYQAGFNQAIEETQNIISSSETIINGAYQAQKEILSNTEKEMLNLVIAISRKVIQKELKMQPDIILRLTEAAIKELRDREVVKLIVNPQCVAIITKASEILKKRINSLEVIKIIEDKSIPIGGVLVESASGKIDATIDTQLEEIYNRLIDEATTNPAILETPEPKILPSKGVQSFATQQNIELE